MKRKSIIAKCLSALLIISMLFPAVVHAEEELFDGPQAETDKEENLDGASEKYAYVVRHWQQKVEGDPYIQNEDNYKLVESSSGSCDPHTTITPAVKSYSGFTAPQLEMWQVDINGQYFDYYYTRNTYSITLNTSTGISRVSGAGDYLYGAPVTIVAQTSYGYTFSGWTGNMTSSLTSYSFSMPASNQNITANATPEKNISYQVNYWQQNLDGNADIEDEDNYSLIARTSGSGTAFDEVTPKLNTYTGFIAPAPQTKQITPDGGMTIDYYYRRQTYNVELTAGTGIDEVSGGGDYLYGQTATIDALMTPGYGFTKWSGTASYSSKATSFIVTKDMKLTAEGKIQTFSVTYYLDGGKNVKTNPTSYKTSDSIVLADPEKNGYFFAGWFLDPDFTNEVTTIGNGMAQNVKVYAKWIKKTRTLKVTYGNQLQNSGTAIDLSKLKIISTMSNGVVEEIPADEVKLSKDRIDYGDNEIVVEYDGAKASFSVSCDVLTLLKGQSYTVSSMAKMKKEKGYKALSSSKKIATMTKKGKITAKSRAGEATLTALRGDGSTQEFKVCVEIPKWTKKYKMSKGDTQNVNMTGVTQKITYQSSDKTIAPVDEFGNITAKRAGKAIIYTIINGKKYKTKVTVQK